MIELDSNYLLKKITLICYQENFLDRFVNFDVHGIELFTKIRGQYFLGRFTVYFMIT